MKNKSANMPAFLIPSDSSDEEAAAAPAEKPAPAAPLSRAPSPFLTHEAYMTSYYETQTQDQLTAVNTALAGVSVGQDIDDKMSLSPLSEGGDLAELPDNTSHPQFPGQPGYWPGHGYYQGGGYYPQEGQDQW